MHLDRRPPVGQRRLVGQELGLPRRRGRITHVGLVGRHRGGVDGRPGHLGADHHVGAQVLDGLEAADGAPELPALLGVVHGQFGGPRRGADLEGGREHGPVPQPHRGRVRAGHRRASGQVGHGPQRGQRVHRAGHGHGVDRPGVDGRHTVRRQDEEDVEVGQVLDQHRGHTARRPAVPLDHPDDGRAGVGAVHQAGGQVRGHERPGDEGPPQLLEDQGGLGQSQSDAAVGLGHAQVEDPGVTQFRPCATVDHVIGRLEGPDPLEAEPALAQPSDPLGQVDLEFRQFEVHVPTSRSPGRPSGRAPWGARGCARPRCSAGSGRSRRRW